MRYIIAATGFALVGGIALGAVVSRGLDGPASAAPPPESRLIVVAEGVTLAPLGSFVSDMIETADCDTLAVFADHSVGASLVVALQLSADGTTVSGKIDARTVARALPSTVSYFNDNGISIVAPKVAVEFKNTNPGTPGNITKAWLFCSQ